MLVDALACEVMPRAAGGPSASRYREHGTEQHQHGVHGAPASTLAWRQVRTGPFGGAIVCSRRCSCRWDRVSPKQRRFVSATPIPLLRDRYGMEVSGAG